MQPTTQISFSPVSPNVSGRKSVDTADSDSTSKFEDILKKHLPDDSESNLPQPTAIRKNLTRTQEKSSRVEHVKDDIGIAQQNNIDALTSMVGLKMKTDDSSGIYKEEKSTLSGADDLISLISGAITPGFYFQQEQLASASNNTQNQTENLRSGIDDSASGKNLPGSSDLLADMAIHAGTDEPSSTSPSANSGFRAILDVEPGDLKVSRANPNSEEKSFLAEKIDQAPVTILQNAQLKEPLTSSVNNQHIPSPVGSSKWGDDVGQKVVWLINKEETSATLTLNPPDLGPMKVVVHVENGQAHATFSADQPEVRQALLDSMPKLREVMEEAGISFGQANVSQNNSGSRDESSEGNQRKSSSISDIKSGLNDETGPKASASATTIERRGLVDTFV
jgi:flagellar hook-length control protein FliK